MKRIRVTRALSGVAVIAAALMVLADSAGAQQLVYHPVNPAFGGNPLNGQWLLSNAQAQKRAPDVDFLNRDPLSDFQQGLQRQILSALSRELIMDRFGENLDLTQPGRYELGDFTIEIVPGLGGVQVLVTNNLTGEQTSVTIPQY